MRLLFIPALIFLFAGGCSRDTSKQAPSAEPVISRQHRQGSTTVVVSLSETNISTAGKIQLMIDVHAPSTDEVLFPDISAHIEPFSIAGGYTEPIQTLPNGRHRHRRVWMLVPDLPGDTIFQSIEIQTGSSKVKTKPFTVRVTSLLPKQLENFELKDIARPIDLLSEQRKQQRRWLYAFGTALGLALAGTVFKFYRRSVPLIVPTPHEAALNALANLPVDELERIQALTELLLAFIGGYFNLLTSAKTIPEILPRLPMEIPEAYKARLEEVLIAGEQIRFSNKIPAGFTDELEEFIRSFIEEIKEVPCD